MHPRRQSYLLALPILLRAEKVRSERHLHIVTIMQIGERMMSILPGSIESHDRPGSALFGVSPMSAASSHSQLHLGELILSVSTSIRT